MRLGNKKELDVFLGSYNATPTLNQFGNDLTKDATLGKIDPIVGRTDEIERIIQILSRRGKNNPCLIGEPGVGKTAVVEGLATQIVLRRCSRSVKKQEGCYSGYTGYGCRS